MTECDVSLRQHALVIALEFSANVSSFGKQHNRKLFTNVGYREFSTGKDSFSLRKVVLLSCQEGTKSKEAPVPPRAEVKVKSTESQEASAERRPQPQKKSCTPPTVHGP